MKTNQLIDAAENITTTGSYDSRGALDRTVREEAYQNNACIVVADANGNVESYENMLGSSSVYANDITKNFGTYLYSLKSDFEDSDHEILTRTLKNDDYETDVLLVVTAFRGREGIKYIFLESTLEMMNSTADIIKQQLLYITIILFELAFIITLFISSRLSNPISRITKTAKRFAEGDYNTKFEGSGYVEALELAEVLDKARRETLKVTDLRKDLIANVSHDLRTPLTIIKSYAEMIKDLSGDNPEKRNEHIQVIIDESDRLSALVSSMLTISKFESGNLDLDIREFSINKKLDEVLKRYRLLVENEGYDITLEKDEDRVCSADISKIDQVLYNLINNAVNYCGEGKKIIIRQKNKESSVRIEIIDDGAGIPKEDLPLIFDRYYRNERHKRDKVGTGLGLSIVKGILKKHEFPFGVISEEGKGSTFWFEIVEK